MPFAVRLIALYVVGCSALDAVSKAATLVFQAALAAALVCWIFRNGHGKKYGLGRIEGKIRSYLYFLPLAFMVSVNVWFGLRMKAAPAETAVFVLSMLLVGFLEELIFRGVLFRALEKDSPRAAVIVSSVTFGAGHIVNLVNGSGADVYSNLCQVLCAMAAGFLFVILFLKCKSLWPAIAANSLLNALSVFSVPPKSLEANLLACLALILLPAGYTLFLLKRKA